MGTFNGFKLQSSKTQLLSIFIVINHEGDATPTSIHDKIMQNAY